MVKKLNRGRITQYKTARDLNGLRNCQVVVDAILGTGAKGDLKEPINSIVRRLNEMEAVKIAVDVPTGLDCDSGFGNTVFNADITVTLAELKRGLFIEKGYSNAGIIVKGGIGIGDEFFNSTTAEDFLIEKPDAVNFIPEKHPSLHKYTAGKVYTIAGSAGMPGAAILSAKSALYSGAGASILSVPGSVRQIAQSKLDSAIVESFSLEQSEFFTEKVIPELKSMIEWSDATVIGPGLGRNEATISAVVHLLKRRRTDTFVIDADALYALQSTDLRKMDLRNFIFTPHHQEFADLMHIPIAVLKSDILKYGKNFAKRHATTLVLKGAPTVIFSPEGDAFFNTAGNAGMAKFGSGDVLTGIIAAFAAQKRSLLDSTIAAVFVHSYSADLLLEECSIHGITAEGILNNISKTIKRMESEIV